MQNHKNTDIIKG